MENSKLLELLRVLEPKEISRLGDFLRSPFYNKQDIQIRLYEDVIRFAPEYQSPELDKNAVFARIFGKTAVYNDSKMRLLMSDAVKLVEKFIAVVKVENIEVSYGIELMHFYTERLPKYFEPTLKLTKRVNEKYLKSGIISGYFYYNYLIELSLAEYNTHINSNDPNSNIWHSAKALDAYYFVSKLRDFCHMYALKQSISSNKQIIMEEDIIRYIEVYNYHDVPILNMFYAAYLLITKSDEHHFELLRTYLKEYTGIINDNDMRNFYIWANNFCSKQFNKGNNRYYSIALELFQQQIDSKIIYAKETFPQPVFKNIVTIALRAKKIDWASNFVENYYRLLQDTCRELVYRYSLAQICFAKQDYPQAQQQLWEAQQQPNKDLYHKTGIYRLWLKLYYTIGEIDTLENALNTYRVFLHREKVISATSLQANRNFINTMYKLLELPFHSLDKIVQCEQKVLACDYVAERDWLLEKINEVKLKSQSH